MNFFKLFLFCTMILIVGCEDKKIVSEHKEEITKTDYETIKTEVHKDSSVTLSDTANIFDSPEFDPRKDTMPELLREITDVYEADSNFIVKFDKRKLDVLQDHERMDTIIVGKETFTRDLKNITAKELAALRFNLDMAREAKAADTVYARCKRDSCPVYARISKKAQRMYLYVNGEIIDTFKVSTGDKKHETPAFDTKPNGLMFKKYTSKKYPGGNYNGLGNMPYVVFIKGGYGIHGTTKGNIKRLGNKASHGCVRLHPENARVFFELVKLTGPANTWITISEE